MAAIVGKTEKTERRNRNKGGKAMQETVLMMPVYATVILALGFFLAIFGSVLFPTRIGKILTTLGVIFAMPAVFYFSFSLVWIALIGLREMLAWLIHMIGGVL